MLIVSGTTTLNATSAIIIDGGTFNTGALTNNGTLIFNTGTLGITGGGITVGAGGLLGSVVSLIPGQTLNISGSTTINGNATLTLDGGNLITGMLVVDGTLGITQAGASINTSIVTGSLSTINVNANNVAPGSAASITGFNHQGVLNVGANTVTLNSAGYSRLGVLTTLAGGTISVPNGIYLSGGGNLVGNGSVNARFTGDSGSVIEANGASALGDAASPAGYNFAGELRTKQFAVTLKSGATARMGNLTALGSGASPGTLSAANGFFVDFGDAITGFGTINSTNTQGKRAIINGAVQGNSVAQPITLAGYIKGSGTFTNVLFTGTFSPGLSPTSVSAGNLALSSTSTLIMEIGGLTPGSDYDRIQASGAVAWAARWKSTCSTDSNPNSAMRSTFSIGPVQMISAAYLLRCNCPR